MKIWKTAQVQRMQDEQEGWGKKSAFIIGISGRRLNACDIDMLQKLGARYSKKQCPNTSLKSEKTSLTLISQQMAILSHQLEKQ